MSKNKQPDRFACKLKELRVVRKISQADLAKRLEITRSAYSYYEIGKCRPKMKTLAKISSFYGVSIEDFYNCV